jgi:hypothetical protein
MQFSPAAACLHPSILRTRALWGMYIVVLLAISVFQITDTYRVFSHTYDEPAHIAAGIELLERGTFTYEQKHPPLARLATALGPYLLGARLAGTSEPFPEVGTAILYSSGRYMELLTAARLGVLPFFILLVIATWVWAWREFGTTAAAVAALLVSTAPTVLAHAGLATTDVPFTALFVVALFAFVLWLERPDGWRSAALGGVVALVVTAKLSALVFLPASFLGAVALRWWCERGRWTPILLIPNALRALPLGAAVFVSIVWIIYGCPADPLQPFSQLWAGVQELAEHNARGHYSFFWGEVRDNGWWIFFPTAFLVKTPIPLLLLAGYGCFVLVRKHRSEWRRLVPLASALIILITAMPSRINLGLRHILPIFPLLAIVAGAGVSHLLKEKGWPFARGAAILLLIGQVAISAAAHPDYLAYFNPLAGSRPERLLAGSDLDWGQDVNRTAAELRAREIRHVAVAMHGSANLQRHGFPPYAELEPHKPVTGWIVVSLTEWSINTNTPPFDGYRWLEAFDPVAIIGKTVRLYRIDSDTLSRTTLAVPR